MFQLGELESDDNVDSEPLKIEEFKEHDYAQRNEEKLPDFSCDNCDVKCMSKGGLTKHLKAKHREETIEIVVGSKMCAFCNITYKRNEFQNHMKIHHHKSELLFLCEFCDAKFLKKCKLERHMNNNIHKQKREKMVCSLCSYETWSQDNLKRHMHRHYNNIKCSICDYTTPVKVLSRSTA